MPSAGLPGGTPSAGLPGGSKPGATGSGTAGGLPDAGTPGGGQQRSGGAAGTPSMGGAGSSGDPGDIFDRSLEDFDGEIGREREAIAQAGKGSGGAAAGSQTADRAVVSRGGSAGSGGMGDMDGMGGTGGMGGMPGGMSGRMPGGMTGTGPGGGTEQTAGAPRPGSGASAPGADSRDGDSTGTEAGEDAGRGQTQVRNPNQGGDVETSERDGGRVATIPDDIQASTGAEDQVARQLKEAAMAETDPVIREALWDEYRRHMGIRKR